MFFSDNGAVQSLEKRPQDYEGRFGPYPVLGDNGPLRGWIGELYDGCARTPALVHWPGVLKPGAIGAVTSVLDLHPTFVALAGGKVGDQLRLEGRNIWLKLSGRGELEPMVLYWRTHNGRQAAVRQGDWKLIVDLRAGENELFNMKDDPNATRNLAAENLDLVQRLTQLLERQATLDP